MDIDQVLGRLRRMAAELGLPFGDRKMTYNSRPAQELGKWAETRGLGEASHWAAFKAYFGDGLNIYRNEVLAGIAKSLGLDPVAATGVLENGEFREAVAQDWSRARDLGVSVVPTFAIDGEFMEGAHPYEAMAALMNRHGVALRKEQP